MKDRELYNVGVLKSKTTELLGFKEDAYEEEEREGGERRGERGR